MCGVLSAALPPFRTMRALVLLYVFRVPLLLRGRAKELAFEFKKDKFISVKHKRRHGPREPMLCCAVYWGQQAAGHSYRKKHLFATKY